MFSQGRCKFVERGRDGKERKGNSWSVVLRRRRSWRRIVILGSDHGGEFEVLSFGEGCVAMVVDATRRVGLVEIPMRSLDCVFFGE